MERWAEGNVEGLEGGGLPSTGGCLRVADGVAVLKDYAFAERREIVEAVLPDSLVEIGRHVFYNCRGLERVSFADTLREIGDGAFKNCGRLHELHIRMTGTTAPRIQEVGGEQKEILHPRPAAGLKGILSEQEGAFTVYFYPRAGGDVGGDAGGEPGKLGGGKAARSAVYFPAYLHEYEENTPARILNQLTHGIGVHYRECVRDQGIDYAAYDGVFKACASLDEEAAVQVAFLRCCYPYELRREAEEKYLGFLRERRLRLAGRLSEEGDLAALRRMVALPLFMSEQDWNEAVEQAREKENWEAVSLLMQERQVRYGTTRKKYDL